jgi:PhnB protein
LQLAPYLFFDGTCEEALTFYARVLAGEIASIMRFGEAPDGGSVPDEQKNLVMHATFVADGITFMASDSGIHESGEMRRVSLSLAPSSRDEGARVFTALAAGGTVTMPFEPQFWGASFGTLTDRFGIRWMVNAG